MFDVGIAPEIVPDVDTFSAFGDTAVADDFRSSGRLGVDEDSDVAGRTAGLFGISDGEAFDIDIVDLQSGYDVPGSATIDGADVHPCAYKPDVISEHHVLIVGSCRHHHCITGIGGIDAALDGRILGRDISYDRICGKNGKRENCGKKNDLFHFGISCFEVVSY